MGSLRRADEDMSYVALAGSEVFLEVGVELEDVELVEADEAGDELEDEELLFKGEFVVGAGEVLGEEGVGEALGIVEEVERGKVESMRLVL